MIQQPFFDDGGEQPLVPPTPAPSPVVMTLFCLGTLTVLAAAALTIVVP